VNAAAPSPRAATWAAFVERHHRALLIGSLVLCAVSALSLTRLRLDVDVLGMLPRGEPAFDDFKTFVADFGQLDELLILIDGPQAAREQVAGALTARLAGLDTIGAVQGRVDTAAAGDTLLGPFLFNYLPVDAYAEVRQRLTPEGIAGAVAADKAMLAAPFDVSLARTIAADPLGLRRIAARQLAASAGNAMPGVSGGYVTSADGTALLLAARPKGSAFDIPFSERLLAQVRDAVEQARAASPAPVRIELTGSYVFALEDASTMRADIQRYTVLALVGVLAVFWIGYGSLRVVPFVAYQLAFSTLLAFALSLLIYDQLNALSLSFAAILYGLSTDSCIHFYSRLERARIETGDPRTAIAVTLDDLGWPLLASSTTTAAVFIVIAWSCLGIVQELGVLTAIGMAITTAQFFVLYPALGLIYLRWSSPAPQRLDTPRLGRLAAACRQRPRLVRAIALLVTVAGALAALRVPLDPSLQRLRPADSPALRVQEEIAARFARPDRGGAILVRGATADAALVAGERVAERLRAYRADGLVGDVHSADVLLPSADVQRARLAEYAALPRAEALTTLEAELRRQGFRPERFTEFFTSFAAPRTALVSPGDPALAPFALVLDRFVRQRPDGAIAVVYTGPAASDWPDLATRLRTDLAELRPAVAARALLEHTLRGVLQRELFGFLALSLLANLVLLAVILARLRDALAVLAPVVMVVVVLFALMWALGMPIDPINLIVTPLLLGIGVDNGAYVVSAARAHGDIGTAVRVTGRAISLTTFTTVAGFGFLAFSTYPPLASMGLLMAVGLILSLVTTVVVLPALFTAEATAAHRGSA
jgi:predicted exporter